MNLAELIHRIMTISSRKNTEKMMALADASIFLKVDQFGLLDFKKYQKIAEAGYQQAKEQLTAQNIDKLLNLEKGSHPIS